MPRTAPTLVAASGLVLSTLACAGAPGLPSGHYQAADGTGVMLASNPQGWTMSDPTAPGVVISGDYRGGCMVSMQGQPLPCLAQVGDRAVSVSVPSIPWSVQVRYTGGAAPSLPAVGSNPGYAPAPAMPSVPAMPSAPAMPPQPQVGQPWAQAPAAPAQPSYGGDATTLDEVLLLMQQLGYLQQGSAPQGQPAGGGYVDPYYGDPLYGNGGAGGWNYNSNHWGGSDWGYGGSDGNTSYYNTGNGGVMCSGGSCEVW